MRTFRQQLKIFRFVLISMPAEAAIHAMRKLYNDKYCEAVQLVETSNAFYTLNRKAVMHNFGILFPILTTFVKNTYKQPAHLILSDKVTLTSDEGTTQGDSIAMAVYTENLIYSSRKNKSTEHWS